VTEKVRGGGLEGEKIRTAVKKERDESNGRNEGGAPNAFWQCEPGRERKVPTDGKNAK